MDRMHPNASHGQLIRLEKNTLYIELSFVNSVPQWAFLHVDASGKATRHQWIVPYTTKKTLRGNDCYHQSALPIPSGGTDATAGPPFLSAYSLITVSEYYRRPPSTTAAFQQACASAAATLDPTAMPVHTRSDLASRTWCTTVLAAVLHSPTYATMLVNQVTEKRIHATGPLVQMAPPVPQGSRHNRK